MMVSTHMRGAVISTSVYEGFPSTCTQGRGIAVPRSNQYIRSILFISNLYKNRTLRFDTIEFP